MNRNFLFYIFIALYFGSSLPLIGQQKSEVVSATTIKHQLRLQHDNDFFALTDRYYTSCLYLSYTHRLQNGILGKNEQLSYTIGQEVFT
ncbi:lipid A-modifier LpxR family protein, partial [Muriicola sp.]|uniref:lipid A-modifier LpxR family protein n=1 Tax=Muriicola sp. TaxID=2020856 RepID=UPI003C740790